MHSHDHHRPQLPANIPPQPDKPSRLSLAMFKRGPWPRVLKIGGIVAGVLVALLVAVNLLVSADWVQERVAARIKEQTGRDLTVAGSTMLLFTPGPRVVITDAKITDPEAAPGSADLSVAKLTLDIGFGELFSRQIDAERVVLKRPVLTVRLGDDAAPFRWGAPKPTKIKFAKAEAGGLPKRHREIHLKDVRIKDGTVVIIYDDKDAEKRIEHINARLSLPAVTDPLTGSGKLDWKDQTVDFSFELATPADLRAERPARLLLALDTAAIAARFDGSLATKPELIGKGKLSAKAHSIPSVLAWMRETPAVSTAIGDGELASDVSWTKSEITFSNSRFALEHASGQGQAVVALKSPRPHIRAALALDFLDLNPFLEGAKQPKKKQAAARPEAASGNAPPAPSAPKDWFSNTGAEVETVVTPPPPSVTAAVPQAMTAMAQPARVAPPAAFDADVNLNVRKSRVGHLDIGPSSLGIAFRDGVMTATLGGVELYGGQGSGTLTVDASKPVPSFNGAFQLEGVQARPLLTDAAQFNMIAGRTKLNLEISGEGEDADEIKSSLDGQGSVVVSDGSIQGIDITAFISALGEGDLDLRQGPDAKTAFSDLGGSFTITDGVAETNNLKMVSPLLKVTAEGKVDLAASMLDMLARPEIVEGPEGKSGANDLAGLAVPVRIEGPLDGPRFSPQIGAVFSDPENASKTVNKIGEALQKTFKGKPVGEALGRFLGNVQIGGAGRKKPPAAQARKAPPSGQLEQGDSDEITDPDLEEILR